MKFVMQVVKEQFLNLNMIFSLGKYDIKSKYQSHYLGVIWQLLNPLLQVSVYWLVFGLGIRSGNPVGEIPFLAWLLTGLIPWFFISPTITQGANSVYARVNLVSKMKFPISILPTITIVGNSINFIIMLLLLVVLLLFNNIFGGIYLLQLPYYLLCLYSFLFAITLLFSTLSILARDFQLIIQSTMRLLLFLSPVLWDPSHMPELDNFLKLNPLYYLIDGFRNAFLAKDWFFNDLEYTLYFWITTISILFVGSLMHITFRKKFVDYL